MIANNLEIQKLTQEHIEFVATQEQTYFSTPWRQVDLQKSIQDENTDFFVLVNDGRALGYVGVVYGADTADIVTLFVCPDNRRGGYASKMLLYVFEVLCERGKEKVFLEVRENNVAARKLYEKHGFLYLNKRRRYYTNPTEDAWVMIKEMKR